MIKALLINKNISNIFLGSLSNMIAYQNLRQSFLNIKQPIGVDFCQYYLLNHNKYIGGLKLY